MPSVALERHPATPCAALRRIEVSLERAGNGALRVAFALEGDIDRLRVPPPRLPRAAERLWEHTCCEIFAAPPGGAGYREFNFSPSGEWAAYEFARYREGRAVEISPPRIEVRRSPRRLELEAHVQVQENGLRLGLAAVIEDAQGSLSYWALRHAPGKPDFHHPAAFALELDEVRH